MKNCIINKVNRIFIQYKILVKKIFYDKVNSFVNHRQYSGLVHCLHSEFYEYGF
jgi:hypothetical protein